MLNQQINFHEVTSVYDDIPLELLMGLHDEIHKNIKKGILSEVMYSELHLMKDAAKRKGIRFLPFDK
ncbi:hypothetical protein [Halobacillus seohaensis]|uniref:Uncharacterized protein n=1 Tax=Halobacillus seohaensis TaxID=447421 RepID=A0ABW2EJA0_9BACI